MATGIYPFSSARRDKSGMVILGFTISKSGTVMDPNIIESRGGSAFEKSSLAVLKQWRYAPKFEDGKAVEAYSTVQLDFKMN